MFRSVLFLGISLSICAVERVAINGISVTNITTTTVDLEVEFTRADSILIYVKPASESEYAYHKSVDVDVSVLSLEAEISGLTPATKYNIKVEAVGVASERVESEVSFVTQVAVP